VDAEQESVQALRDVPENEPREHEIVDLGDQRAVRLAYEVEIVIDGVRRGVALRRYGYVRSSTRLHRHLLDACERDR
jgi:hypothetical protein